MSRDLGRIEIVGIRLSFLLGFIGVVQFLFVTTWLMSEYPGGRIGYAGSEGYDFFRNFLSDLGRTRGFGRGFNPLAEYYKYSLVIAGLATILFFCSLAHFLFYISKNWWAVLVSLMAILAGVGYIGLGMNPIDEDYWRHRFFVQLGFIGFWWMSVFTAVAITRSPFFPNKYARMLMWFLALLGVQICVMIFGPRSWSGSTALFLQVTAQKIVVYSEILVMLVLNVAALRALSRYENSLKKS